MSEQDNLAFIEAYLDNWRKTPPDLTSVFHPEGKLLPPGNDEPLDVAGAQSMVEGTRAAIPDVSLGILSWAERDGQIFIEWEMTGTIQGQKVRWCGINRNTLRGAKSVDAVSYWDRLGLVDQVNPGRPKSDLMSLLRQAAQGEG